ncbi:MAG: spore cortex biosynthesis protein YabQ [Clostridia bacterium]|nr:spore cortex biosynthesis protein YabQ [Clostridia bacterium]
MEYTHYTDLHSMLQALAAGVLMGLYYDVFRLMRRLTHFDRISVAIQDIFFWLTSAVYLFFVCVRLNNGYIRIYFIFFALTGWGIYYATVGRIAFAILDVILKLLGRVLKSVRKVFFSAAKKIYIIAKGKSELYLL